MKTAKEWFLTLPEPYGQMAIEATEKQDKDKGKPFLNREIRYLEDALLYSFEWGRSDQGYDFWDGIYDNIENP